MFVVFNNFRSYWLVVAIGLFLMFSCSRTEKVQEENQKLNRELFHMFMESQFGAKVFLPKYFVLKTYDNHYYRWSYSRDKCMKMSFDEDPDFKGDVYDTQNAQLHVVFCKVNNDLPIVEAIDSINRITWEITSPQDSVLVEQEGVQKTIMEGKWYLNTKTIGGQCKGKVFEKADQKLLVYYMAKEYNDDKKEMSALGDSLLNTIDFF